ncbi:MAG: sulfur dioxygenase [Gammaproteobacteria bacterium]
MIFRQLFDNTSSTYTYLLASRMGGEALIIDPVIERVEHYLRLLRELDLRLVKAVDTHVHADHITGLGALRDQTRCVTVMGAKSAVDVVSLRVNEGDQITAEGLALDVIYTPGHTDDSYSFLMGDRVFTGDTLMIRGTGRTDFQNGNPYDQYESIFGKLLTLPDETLVYPAHDYKGDTVSTVAEERAFNPRLQVRSVDEYADIMNGLNLANPQMMDVAVPANLRIGMAQDELRSKGLVLTAIEVQAALHGSNAVLVDLRDDGERARDGEIPTSLHVPYATLGANVGAGGLLRGLCDATGRQLIFYCAFGERSAMAVQTAHESGLGCAVHLDGGIAAWRDSGFTVE